MCDYPFFIPQVVLFANSSLFWFKVTNEHREFRNYLIVFFFILCNRDEQILVCHALLPSFVFLFSGKWIDDIPDAGGTFYFFLASSVNLALRNHSQYRQFQIFLHIFL